MSVHTCLHQKAFENDDDQALLQEIVSTTSDTLPLEQTPRITLTMRCHLSAITSIVYIDIASLVVTGGKDATVRLWTDVGRYIGTFGQPQRWKISLPVQVTNEATCSEC